MATVIEVSEEVGAPGTRYAWGEFVADNADDLGLAEEIEADLIVGREYAGGGGAAPEFVVRAAEYKRCTCCGRLYQIEADFLALPLPSNGRGVACGMVWRNCSCGGTITVEIAEEA